MTTMSPLAPYENFRPQQPVTTHRRGLLIDVEPGDGADGTAEVCVGDGVAAAVVDGRQVKQAGWDVGAVVGDNRNNDG